MLYLVIIFIVILFGWYVTLPKISLDDNKKISELKSKMAKFLYFIGSNKVYNLYQSDDMAKTVDKKDIYIVLRDKNGEFYDDNTLFGVLIHEMAHILCGSDNHDYPFEDIEKQLYDQANVIDFYSKKKGINPNYPCII